MSKHTFPSILCRVCAPRPKAFLFFDSKWHAVNNFLFSCAQAPNSLYKFKKKKVKKKSYDREVSCRDRTPLCGVTWSTIKSEEELSFQALLLRTCTFFRVRRPRGSVTFTRFSSQYMQVQTLASMDPRAFYAKTQLITGFRELCFPPFLGQHLCWLAAPEKPQTWWPIEMQ